MSKEQTNFLADTFEPESFIFSKPKKYKNDEIMVSKIKNKYNEMVVIQFPKMTLSSDYNKCMDVEFINQLGYNKKVITFLSNLDDFIIKYINSHSIDWFGKEIPLENVKEMYTSPSVINSPSLSFNIKTGSEIINKQNETLDNSELVKGAIVECISHLKYIVFTKDKCFLRWEVCTAKIHKKITKVPNFGFIEDPADISDDELSDEETITFF
jgi:hypothetical protein